MNRTTLLKAADALIPPTAMAQQQVQRQQQQAGMRQQAAMASPLPSIARAPVAQTPTGGLGTGGYQGAANALGPPALSGKLGNGPGVNMAAGGQTAGGMKVGADLSPKIDATAGPEGLTISEINWPAVAAALGLGGVVGGSLGASVGIPSGAIAGSVRGNTPEGIGRGYLRGGATGFGAGSGALAGALAAGVISPKHVLPAMGAGAGLGGAAGWALSGKLLGDPVGDGKERQDKLASLLYRNLKMPRQVELSVNDEGPFSDIERYAEPRALTRLFVHSPKKQIANAINEADEFMTDGRNSEALTEIAGNENEATAALIQAILEKRYPRQFREIRQPE